MGKATVECRAKPNRVDVLEELAGNSRAAEDLSWYIALETANKSGYAYIPDPLSNSRGIKPAHSAAWAVKASLCLSSQAAGQKEVDGKRTVDCGRRGPDFLPEAAHLYHRTRQEHRR